MMERKKLNDVFPDGITGDGIFSALQLLDVPWKDSDISGSLDLIYYGDVSGDKYISPMVNKMLSDNGDLSADNVTQIAQSIYNLFINNWSKLWNTLSFEYDPIQNYSMVERMTDDETVTEYGRSHAKTGSESDDRDRTDNTIDGVYGFNSSNPSNSDKSDVTIADNNVHSYNITDADTGSDTETRNYELRRSGNIGVTTSQQMIQSERDLWVWNYFTDVVFPDLDRILTIQIY